MHDVRESSFHCRFDSPARRCTANVRAWDAAEALQLFLVELRADGIDEAGDVVVCPASGGPSATAHVPRAA